MNKFKLLIFDLFFVVSGMVGVGFATGREIRHFFLSGKYLMLAVTVFFCVFFMLCWYILHIKHKYGLRDLTKLNKLAFGRFYKLGDTVLMLVLIVTNSAMLSGVDNLAKNYLGLNFPLMSFGLSFVTFFIALGGVERIKKISSTTMPILIFLMLINSLANIEHVPKLNGEIFIDFIYPIIFCCGNFTTLISTLISTKSKPGRLSFATGIIISVIIIISAISISNISTDMPMITAGKALGDLFFIIYFVGIILALFTTSQITTCNCLNILNKNTNNKYFNLLLILFISQSIANLGFNFIMQYLYTLIGVMGVIYLIILIINLINIDLKNK